MTRENRQGVLLAVVLLLTLILMLVSVTGVSQCAEHGAIRFSAGQAGGDLSAYLISLYWTEGSGYLTVLTAGDQDGMLSGTEEGSSIIASAEGTLALIEAGAMASQDEQEVVGEYNGEMQFLGPLRLAP